MTKTLIAIAALTIGLMSGVAQADTVVGDTVEREFSIGSRVFALPLGKWKVISSADGRTGSPSVGMVASAPTKTLYLIQTNDKNVFVASILIVATTASTNVGSWNDDNCERKDSIYVEKLDGDFKFPACLILNYAGNFWRSAAPPQNEFAKVVWQHLRDNQVILPSTAILSWYIKYFQGDFVSIRYYLNPDLGGVEKAIAPGVTGNPWNQTVINASPQREQYMALVKTWSLSMAESSRHSLLRGNPGGGSSPELPKLK